MNSVNILLKIILPIVVRFILIYVNNARCFIKVKVNNNLFKIIFIFFCFIICYSHILFFIKGN